MSVTKLLILTFLALVACTLFVLKKSRIPTQPITHYTSLPDAVRAGDISEAKRLISLGNSLYEKDGDYEYPLLFIAVYRGDLEMVKCLTEGGANIHEVDRDTTALHCAASQGHAAVVQYLLDCGINVDICDRPGDTALHHCDNDEIIRMLLDRGADINATAHEGSVLLNAIAQDNPDRLNYLLKRGADPSLDDGSGITPLHYAATMDTPNTTEIILLLMSHGAPIDELAYGVEYGTPLAFAARNNNLKAALLLLSQGADIHKADDILGESPLHTAARYGHADMMNFLIKHGANIDQKDTEGLTAIELAATHDLHYQP